MSLYKLSLIFVGGGLGSICRFLISYFLSAGGCRFAWPTFVANLISCFILGWCFKYYKMDESNHVIWFFIMIGFCGGMSTFSTFTSENFQLLQQAQFGLFATYSLLSLAACLLFFWIGFKLL